MARGNNNFLKATEPLQDGNKRHTKPYHKNMMFLYNVLIVFYGNLFTF